MISIDIHSSDVDSSFNEANFIDWKALIAKSLTGEKISVKKAGIEVLQITPVIPSVLPKQRKFGSLRGQITVPNDPKWGDDEVQAMFDESLNKGVS